MTWYGMVWHGMTWYGMAWHGMAWHDMTRYDTTLRYGSHSTEARSVFTKGTGPDVVQAHARADRDPMCMGPK